MKLFNVKSALLLSCATALLLFSCNKEEDMANVVPSSGSSSFSTTQSGGSFPLLTYQDYDALGTLVVNNNPTFEPNAANYGYQVLDFVPDPDVQSDPLTIYAFDPSHPNAGNLPPTNSPLSLFYQYNSFNRDVWTNIQTSGIKVITCLGSGTNCSSESDVDGSGNRYTKITVKAGTEVAF